MAVNNLEKTTVQCISCGNDVEIVKEREGFFASPINPQDSYNKEFMVSFGYNRIVPTGAIHLCDNCRKDLSILLNGSLKDIKDTFEKFNISFEEKIYVD